eukprot:365441-Chlamydomonas_euryale.AAC.12
MASIVDQINVGAAECQFPDDKKMIESVIKEHHGSLRFFDMALKLQLLLDPLSYKVQCWRWGSRGRGYEHNVDARLAP